MESIYFLRPVTLVISICIYWYPSIRKRGDICSYFNIENGNDCKINVSNYKLGISWMPCWMHISNIYLTKFHSSITWAYFFYTLNSLFVTFLYSYINMSSDNFLLFVSVPLIIYYNEETSFYLSISKIIGIIYYTDFEIKVDRA